ncbi:hypothetical protein [Ancylobacter rudongensis]|uniref:Uncharacterized protein n=1 Tax=Ancylobacter rudongensis TaxID=177413 RepID=A0A1G4SQY1_9HYPH|nr:hypothetical protein [Ancylobacter rudongensis]SCW71518.1 hypothetical protein SAMN05660859_2419 [Ancylobacter rudongensis]
MQTDDGRTVDLRDILASLQPRADRSLWDIGGGEEDFWAMGSDIRRLNALAASGEKVAGTDLSTLAEGIHQLIWGQFRVFEDTSPEPWAIISAFDGCFFELTTDDHAVIALIKKRFPSTRPAT